MATSVYEQLGGEGAIDAAVDRFYVKVLADKRINHHFANTDMNRQRNHQKRFLTQAFGGPATYSGKAMRAAHKHLNLKEADFNAKKQAISDAVASGNVSSINGIINSLRR